jgi:hypothetical protein
VELGVEELGVVDNLAEQALSGQVQRRDLTGLAAVVQALERIVQPRRRKVS